MDDFQAPAMLRRLHHAVVTITSDWHQVELLTRADMNPVALDKAIHDLLAGYFCSGDER
jgi:hypothetical protein